MCRLDFVEDNSLARRLDFIIEIDKMKNVFRRTLIVDGSRRENDAEHSWHLAVMAMILEDYAAEGTDISRVVKMALVHDLIEVYAGDTFAYDEIGNETKAQREKAAADKLFAILPAPQGDEIRALWEEFEARLTPEAKFANAMDRLQPLINNYLTDGHTWKEGAVRSEQVLARNEPLRESVPELWQVVVKIVDASIKKGILLP